MNPPARPVATFSIVGYDPDPPSWGVAVASKFPAVGSVVSWAEAGAGAVATQSFANPRYGPQGLDRMRSGSSVQETLAALLDEDPQRGQRQVGLVDAHGRAATFTGEACVAWAGGLTGRHYAVQGNILVGPQVVEAMACAFEAARGDLPGRLLAALAAGDEAGGDRRGRQSAALYVARAGAGYAGLNDRWIDLRVDDDPQPLRRLTELLDLHRLYFERSLPEDRLALEGQVARRLLDLLRLHAGYAGAAVDHFDPPALQALRDFIGRENFEERLDFENLLIDRPVFEYLLQRSPNRSHSE